MNCSEPINTEVAQAVVVCVTSSSGLVQLASPFVILISVCVAGFGVLSARNTARQRATLDLIEKVESTKHYQTLHAAFSYHRRQVSFSRLHDPQESKDKDERQAVLDYLNHYELISIGIKKKILDDEFYKDWMRGPFVRDWNSASKFIQRERWKWDEKSQKWHYHDALYANFQSIACRWSTDAIRLTKGSGNQPQEPSGPGDEALPDGDRVVDAQWR